MLEAAVNRTGKYFALPYGPSGVAPEEGTPDIERYFKRLEDAGLGKIKRPDLLIIPNEHAHWVREQVAQLGGVSELPFIPEEDPRILAILGKTILAIECENSLWRSDKMPDYNTPLKPMKRLQNQLGLNKDAVVPTIILKDEDRAPLRDWQDLRNIPIHIWHCFYDQAFGIPFDDVESRIRTGQVEPYGHPFKEKTKTIYRVNYRLGYRLAMSMHEPALEAAFIIDTNGQIYPYVKFKGGRFDLTPMALEVMRTARKP